MDLWPRLRWAIYQGRWRYSTAPNSWQPWITRETTWLGKLQHETGRVSTVERVHDDVIKWKQFPRYWPFVRGQWRGTLMFTLICVWINGCVNNREAGDLRRYCAHYGVTVMGLWNISSEGKSWWASYQIRKIAGCTCTGNAGSVFPPPTSKETVS